MIKISNKGIVATPRRISSNKRRNVSCITRNSRSNITNLRRIKKLTITIKLINKFIIIICSLLFQKKTDASSNGGTIDSDNDYPNRQKGTNTIISLSNDNGTKP